MLHQILKRNRIRFRKLPVVFCRLSLLTLSVFYFPASVEAQSVFEEIMHENEGSLPFPFEKLLDQLDAKAGHLTPPRNVLLVPKGRSLQKDQADFANPRLVYQAKIEGKAVFLGHVPGKGELEVIEWNPDLREFDFKLVENYGLGKIPHSHTIRDSKCSQCHVLHAPIFPRGPWREVNHNRKFFAGKHSVIDEIKKYHPDEFHGADLKSLDNTKYPGQGAGPISIQYDIAVRNAANLLQAQKVCLGTCKNDLHCRSVVLQSALEKLLLGHSVPLVSDGKFEIHDLASRTRRFSFPKGFASFKSEVSAHWPSGGFAYPSSTLADLDPFVDPHLSPGFRLFRIEHGHKVDITLQDDETIRNPDRPGLGGASVAGIPLDGEGALIEEPLAPGEFDMVDPAEPRPLTRAISAEDAPYFLYGVGFDCIWPDLKKATEDARNLAGKIRSREEVETLIQDPRVQKVLSGTWPDIRESLMLTLLKALKIENHEILGSYSETVAAEQLLPRSVSSLEGLFMSRGPEVKEMKRTKTGVEGKLEQHCSQCHTLERMPLPFGDLKALSEYRSKSGKSVLDRIISEKRPMPPLKEQQPTWNRDKEEIMEALKVHSHQ